MFNSIYKDHFGGVNELSSKTYEMINKTYASSKIEL